MSDKPAIESELKDNINSIQQEQGKYVELKRTYEHKRDHFVKALNDLAASIKQQ